MKLYQYPNCSTCRKAIKLLTEQEVAFESINITETPPTKTELTNMLASYKGELRKLFNTSGVQYRELKMKDRLSIISDKEAIALLAENGKLIKRPFLLNGNGQGVVGFKEPDWLEFIRSSNG